MSRLDHRSTVKVTVPEFVVRALEYRVSESNTSKRRPGVTFNDAIEWYLVAAITLRDVAAIDRKLPGFAAAVSRWLDRTPFEF
jgi:hypothetical protein